jgi:hypothetical protein
MKRKLLISLLGSLAIVVAAVSVAYAVGTFKANQEGFRQAGEGQAAHLTMRVEAGTADANSDLLPDSPGCAGTLCLGGALSFSITNSSDVPLRVTAITLATYQCGFGGTCNQLTSNKNHDGSFLTTDSNGVPPQTGTGDCSVYAAFVSPANFYNWPTISPHTTLQVNGTDNSQLGAGMIHLSPATPQGCQGATFALGLNVTATEFTAVPGPPNP